MYRDHLSATIRISCYALLAATATAAPTAPSFMGLMSSSNPITLGQSLTLTATVTTVATGKVTFYDGVSILGIGTLAAGQARFNTSGLTSGAHTLHAHYSGDAVYFPSDSPPLAQTVTALPANGYRQVATPGIAGTTVVADFNNDGRPDLAFGGGVWLGNSDGTFQMSASYVGSLRAAGDFNGDGIEDLVVEGLAPIGAMGAAISLLPGNGDGTFRTAVPVGLLSLVSAIVADINGDGKADLVLAGGGIYSILLGNGNYTFRQLPNSAQMGITQLAVADFNGDGKPDLVYTGYPNNGVLLGNGDGTFRPSITFPLGGTLAIADFNGDGKPDLAVQSSRTMNILLGNGDGTFQALSGFTLLGNSYVIDFNGDGKPDFAVAAPEGITFWLGNGDGTFARSPVIYPADGITATGDFNLDGRLDFLVDFSGSYNVSVYLGTATPALTIAEAHSGTFSPGSAGETYTITVGNLQFAPATGPVTVTDSLPPGVTATSIGGAGWTCAPATVTCTRSDILPPGAAYAPIVIGVSVAVNVPGTITNMAVVSGGGSKPAQVFDTIVLRAGAISLTAVPNPATFGQPVTLTGTPTPGATGQVTFYDGAAVLGISPIVNGQATLITPLLAAGTHALHAGYDPDLTSAYAAASSSNVSETVIAMAANGFQPVINYGVPVGSSIVMADFNGDGNADIAYVSNDTVGVLPGNGDGTFRAPLYSYTGLLASSLTVADFNADGTPDLLIAFPGPGGYSVNVFLGNGDGIFRPFGSYAMPSNPFRAAVADFNGDGKSDVALAFSNGTFGVLTGKGDGTFQQSPYYLLSNVPSDMVAADFNGDGKADLAFAFESTAPVSILPGNGDGTFQLPLATSVFGRFMLVADFNGDGKPDLALSQSGTVALGRGDGTFRTGGSIFLDVYSTLLAAADMNGDGKIDLVVSGRNSPIGILPGNGDGTFQAATVAATPGSSGPAVVGDLNRDGRADIVLVGKVRLSSVNILSILLGGLYTGPIRTPLTVWRPSNATWYVDQPNKPSFSLAWGLPGDIPVTADFDHDGLPDYVIWRPLDGSWCISPSSNPAATTVRQWGLSGDIPVPGDYDGDGITDVAVWRPSNGTWYIVPGTNPSSPVILQWGLANDIPIVGDFDGDGKADYVVWRPSTGTWYVVPSRFGATSLTMQWGLPGDIPVAADFDGDGMADYAVWRPSNGTWYIIPSAHPTTTTIIQWGLPGDITVPRDYDGDGKADPAVFRPSNGTWYIMPCSNPASPLIIPWGLHDDIPIYQPAGSR